MTPNERLAQIEVEMKDKKLSTSEMETLIDELLEISESERQKLDGFTKSLMQKRFPWRTVVKGVAWIALLFTLGIHLVKLAWYFILLNWNLW